MWTVFQLLSFICTLGCGSFFLENSNSDGILCICPAKLDGHWISTKYVFMFSVLVFISLSYHYIAIIARLQGMNPADDKHKSMVNARLPPGRLPEAICIICQKGLYICLKGLYLLPKGIVSFARRDCSICPKGKKVCRLPEANYLSIGQR